MRYRVFVYGSLRRGEVNHHLLRDAEYLGQHRTTRGYTMYDLGSFPGVVTGGRSAITGEVYRVSGRILAALDRLEGYPHWYSRNLISSAFGKTWIYLYRGGRRGRQIVASGDWLCAGRWQRPLPAITTHSGV